MAHAKGHCRRCESSNHGENSGGKVFHCWSYKALFDGNEKRVRTVEKPMEKATLQGRLQQGEPKKKGERRQSRSSQCGTDSYKLPHLHKG